MNTESREALISSWDLDSMGVVVDTSRVLPSGFNPMYAKDTPCGACLILVVDGTSWTGQVVTAWDGSSLSPHVIIRHDSVSEVVNTWSHALETIRLGGESELARALCPTQTPSVSQERPPLKPGDHVAYLLTSVSPLIQDTFKTTRVTGVHPLKLENGEHDTVFASGKGEIAGFDPRTNRILFPVESIEKYA